MIPVEKLHSHELYLRIFFERCWLIKKIGQNVGPRLTMSNAEPAGWKAYCRRFRGERLGRGCIVPSLFVEKKRGSHHGLCGFIYCTCFQGPPPLLLDFLRMRKFPKFWQRTLGTLLATYAGGEGSEEKARLQLQLFFSRSQRSWKKLFI